MSELQNKVRTLWAAWEDLRPMVETLEANHVSERAEWAEKASSLTPLAM